MSEPVGKTKPNTIDRYLQSPRRMSKALYKLQPSDRLIERQHYMRQALMLITLRIEKIRR